MLYHGVGIGCEHGVLKNLILTTLFFLEAFSAPRTGYCTDMNGSAETERERERGVIYAELEEMIESRRGRKRGREKQTDNNRQ